MLRTASRGGNIIATVHVPDAGKPSHVPVHWINHRGSHIAPMQGMPELEWLHQLWDLLLELLCGGRVTPQRLQADLAGLAPLDAWSLIPLASGLLRPVADRFTVFTPPICFPSPLPLDSAKADKLAEASPPEEGEATPRKAPPADEAAPDAYEAYPLSPALPRAPSDQSGPPRPDEQQGEHQRQHLGAPEHDGSQGVWTWLLPLVRHLGLPLLDASFARCGPLCEGLRAASPADMVLNKLRVCSDRAIFRV